MGIGCIRFKHGHIRWHTLIRRGRNLFLNMLKKIVRIRRNGLYAKHTLNTRELRQKYVTHRSSTLVIRWRYAGDRYATRDVIHGFKTVSIRTVLYFQEHFERMKISL